MAPKPRPSLWVNPLETVRLLHRLIDGSPCEESFRAVRNGQRERKLHLVDLVRFWIAVILRVPRTLTQPVEAGRRHPEGSPLPGGAMNGGYFRPKLKSIDVPSFRLMR